MRDGKLERREKRDMAPTNLDRSNKWGGSHRRARLSLIQAIIDDV